MTPNPLHEKLIEEFVEKGAELEHARWARWQKYLHSRMQGKVDTDYQCIPQELYEHWERQIATEYKDLSEAEKESDKKEVRQYVALLRTAFSQIEQATREGCVDVLTDLATGAGSLKEEYGGKFKCCGYHDALEEAITKLTT